MSLVLVALVAAAVGVSSCLVGTYEEGELPGASGSGGGGTGGGGSGGLSGGGAGGTGNSSGVGGAGGSGGGTQCTGCTPVAGTEDCCFDHPSSGSVCGHFVSDFGAGCLPADNPGVEDTACPANTTHGLPGCCMPNGLCGFMDTAHGLGCIPAEALGGQPVACTTGSKPCGQFCIDNNSCATLLGTNPIYSCAETCLLNCVEQVTTLLTAPCAASNGCTTTGEKYYSGCLNKNYEYASCMNVVDCGRYCNMVMEACSATSSLQYPDVATCEKVCINLPAGALPATDNSIGCRMQRAVTGQCPAAGPAGALNACGGPCEAYCALYENLCNNDFLAQFSDNAGCLSWCAAKNTSFVPFNYGSASFNPINCRIEQLIDLAGGKAVSCSQIGNATGGLCG